MTMVQEKKHSMDPSVWGPLAWKCLHAAALHDASAFEALVGCFCHTLPCPHCRQELQTYLTEWPIAVLGPQRWVWWVHDQVNAALDKPSITYSQMLRRHTYCPPTLTTDELFLLVFSFTRVVGPSDLATCITRCFGVRIHNGDLYAIATQWHEHIHGDRAWERHDIEDVMRTFLTRCGG